LAEQP